MDTVDAFEMEHLKIYLSLSFFLSLNHIYIVSLGVRHSVSLVAALPPPSSPPPLPPFVLFVCLLE